VTVVLEQQAICARDLTFSFENWFSEMGLCEARMKKNKSLRLVAVSVAADDELVGGMALV
jgi:hypothetical protein